MVEKTHHHVCLEERRGDRGSGVVTFLLSFANNDLIPIPCHSSEGKNHRI